MNRRNMRRRLLRGLVLVPVSWPAWARAEGAVCRELELIHTHTGKRMSCCYQQAGEWQEAAVATLDQFLGDHRSGESVAMDRRLFDLLHELAHSVGLPARYEVISGYRSAATNAMLAASSGGVSERSLHMLGQAIDVRLQGLDSARLAELARATAAGGVGYYAQSDFVHLDTGRVRSWQG